MLPSDVGDEVGLVPSFPGYWYMYTHKVFPESIVPCAYVDIGWEQLNSTGRLLFLKVVLL